MSVELVAVILSLCPRAAVRAGHDAMMVGVPGGDTAAFNGRP